MDTLMPMQNSCNIGQARSRVEKIHVQRYKPRSAE